ncbi:MAG: pseudaminic acid synthase [Gammaproteobacteria bacterium]|nr:pseudaminic acid synthase [Gammaproteobacteria bacterium]
MNNPQNILQRLTDPQQAPLIIAELSGNHGGKLTTALNMVEAAATSGADLIKIQTYRPDTITLDHDSPEFAINSGLWQGRRLYDLYQEAHTPWEWHAQLFARAAALGVPMFSSPFDTTAITLLESLQTPLYKIASFELVDLGLIAAAAKTGKPLILSTGMAEESEIAEAVATIRAHSQTPITLLHCTSSYPAPIAEANLHTISWLAKKFGVIVGLSDHTEGIAVAVAAVALGARVVEKHFTLSRQDGAVDAAFSLEPAEFAAMATACRQAWSALGSVRYAPSAAEEASRQFRRSLYVIADIAVGTIFDHDNLRSIRPANGLHPRYLESVIGTAAERDIRRGEPLAWDMVAPSLRP